VFLPRRLREKGGGKKASRTALRRGKGANAASRRTPASVSSSIDSREKKKEGGDSPRRHRKKSRVPTRAGRAARVRRGKKKRKGKGEGVVPSGGYERKRKGRKKAGANHALLKKGTRAAVVTSARKKRKREKACCTRDSAGEEKKGEGEIPTGLVPTEESWAESMTTTRTAGGKKKERGTPDLRRKKGKRKASSSFYQRGRNTTGNVLGEEGEGKRKVKTFLESDRGKKKGERYTVRSRDPPAAWPHGKKGKGEPFIYSSGKEEKEGEVHCPLGTFAMDNSRELLSAQKEKRGRGKCRRLGERISVRIIIKKR